jgi:lipopolysaccharide transport system permease protein
MVGQMKSRPWQKAGYLRDLLSELVRRDIRLRYRRSVLGVVWSLLNPLAQLLVFNFVFARLLPLNIPNYPLFLFIGLVLWNWFQSSLVSGTGAIVDNRDLIKRPGFPMGILPVVMVMTNFIHLLLALPVVLIFVILNRIQITPAISILPVLFLVQFVLTLSLVYAAAAVHVTFRDTQHLLGIFLLLGFYLSPIIYESSSVPVEVRSIYRLNPLVFLIEASRGAIMKGEWPPASGLFLLFAVSAFLLGIGCLIFKHASQRFVEEL